MSETRTRNTSEEATITTPRERKPTVWTEVHSQDEELEKEGGSDNSAPTPRALSPGRPL